MRVREVLLVLGLYFLQAFRQACCSYCTTGVSPHSGACFWYSTQTMDWQHAELFCHNHGGTLASLETDEEEAFVRGNLTLPTGQEIWLGLRDDVTEGVFHWNSGKALQRENWASVSDQPNGADSQNCVTIQLESNPAHSYNGWQDRECSDQLTFICQDIPPDFYCTEGIDCVAPVADPSPATERTEQSYVRSSDVETATWVQANLSCTGSGMKQFSIRSQQELQAFILRSVILDPDGIGIWMALTDLTVNGMFSYTDGTYPTWIKWDSGAPLAADGNCVYVTTDGYFHVSSCSQVKRVLCETDMALDYYTVQHRDVSMDSISAVFKKENVTQSVGASLMTVGSLSAPVMCAVHCNQLYACDSFTFEGATGQCRLIETV